MKTTEMDVKKNVLEELIALMEGKMLGSMKSEEADSDADEVDDDAEDPKIKGLSISVVDTKKLDDDDEDEDEDPLQAKLKKLFSKE